jgi:transposase-like protein
MKRSCPKSDCNTKNKYSKIVKDGSYFRPSDGRHVQRYKCKNCKKRFSAATFNPCFGQNKRRINHKLKVYLSSGMSLRRCARVLKVGRRTIERKLIFLGKMAKKEHDTWLDNYENIMSFQFDDLQTIEHTKCKPLSVTMAVDAKSRKIIGFEVSKMPATGHFARIAKIKYGKREDQRQQGIDRLFVKIQNKIASNSKILSDSHPFYSKPVKKYFSKANYEQVKGIRGCVAGQGELKKTNNDPLFMLNHTFAMLRANINRLYRRSWCTTKDPNRLIDHLYIYINYHNKILT